MTAQVPDEVRFEGHWYSLAGVHGKGLFKPKKFGLQPRLVSTVCRRGYQCWYTVKDDRLLLSRLEVTLLQDYTEEGKLIAKMGPEINGVRPTEPKFSSHNNLYELDMEIGYTGRILIADDFIASLYVHMGFHPAWKYEKVFELAFKKGKLLEARDVSDKIKVIRDRKCKMPLEPGPGANLLSVLRWVVSTFRQDYHL